MLITVSARKHPTAPATRELRPITMVCPPPINTPTYLRLRLKIREDIVSGQWPLGAHLTLRGLGAHYRVSNVPVREALLQLQGDGMVDMKMNHGAVVTEVDEPWLRDFLAIRDALEDMLTRNACAYPRVESLAVLRRQERAMAEAVAAGHWDLMFDIDRRVTTSLYEMGRNAHAVALLEPRNCLIEAFRRSRAPTPPQEAGRWPERLYRLGVALTQGDVETACAVVAQQLAARREHLRRLLSASAAAAARD